MSLIVAPIAIVALSLGWFLWEIYRAPVLDEKADQRDCDRLALLIALQESWDVDWPFPSDQAQS